MYDYRCRSCGASFEKKVRLGAGPPECPSCGAPGEEVDKLLSAPGFVLKGEGWYRDHYGLKTAKGDKKKGAGDTSSSGGGSDAA